jgi:hypothetical protein
MKPMMIIAPDVMDASEIEELRKNDICVAVAKDPDRIRFMDPIPCQSSRTQIETAAIELSRRVLRGDIFPNNKSDFSRLFVECLLQGSPLQPTPTVSEIEANYFTSEKRAEIQRLARQEAKEERAAAKAGSKQ